MISIDTRCTDFHYVVGSRFLKESQMEKAVLEIGLTVIMAVELYKFIKFIAKK